MKEEQKKRLKRKIRTAFSVLEYNFQVSERDVLVLLAFSV
jgi:hypothetical protein